MERQDNLGNLEIKAARRYFWWGLRSGWVKAKKVPLGQQAGSGFRFLASMTGSGVRMANAPFMGLEQLPEWDPLGYTPSPLRDSCSCSLEALCCASVLS